MFSNLYFFVCAYVSIFLFLGFSNTLLILPHFFFSLSPSFSHFTHSFLLFLSSFISFLSSLFSFPISSILFIFLQLPHPPFSSLSFFLLVISLRRSDTFLHPSFLPFFLPSFLPSFLRQRDRRRKIYELAKRET